MLQPTPPPYDIADWETKPFPERVKMVCRAWAMQGYGTPPVIYLAYLLKIALYIATWFFLCSFTPGLGDPSTVGEWWYHPVAFQKAILWTMAYEGLGFGCGSGPLTGRYMPPFGGFLYFARPGTIRLPPWPWLPGFAGDRRTLFDVVLYVAHYAFLARALVAPGLSYEHFAPTLVLLPLLGLRDKTIFLASRSEHYFTAIVCFAFAGDWIAGSKLVWFAIWVWAATSKLNHHFPSVVATMTSNSPLAFAALRKRMYQDYPRDLRPSKLAGTLAHLGTAFEYAFPVILLWGPGGWVTPAALVGMLLFHGFITSNIPMGVPIEWNVVMVYGGFVLFGHYVDVGVLDMQSGFLLAFLGVILLVVPLYGSLVPAHVSFLCSMRYYAGNWAYSIWLFRDDASKKLDEHITKVAPMAREQLGRFYDEQTITALLSKVIAFRSMHLQGRAVGVLLPKAVDDIEAYEYLDGELIAGVVIGWNFGDGHLHNLQLLEAVQERCNYAEGELRCIILESQPMGKQTMSWKIADAATGVLDQGELSISELQKRQPWPDPWPEDRPSVGSGLATESGADASP